MRPGKRGEGDCPEQLAGQESQSGSQVLAAELGANAGLARELQNPLLPLQVAEGAAVSIAAGGQIVQVPGRGGGSTGGSTLAVSIAAGGQIVQVPGERGGGT